MKMGPGLAPDTQLGPVVSAEQHERVTGYIEKGRSEGAELVAGRRRAQPRLLRRAHAVHDDIRRPRDHARGDLRPRAGGAAVRLGRGGRAARERRRSTAWRPGVWTRDIGDAHRLAALLRAGTVYVNVWGLTDPAAPFGGFKASGVGREHGRAGLEEYLETKTVWTSLS